MNTINSTLHQKKQRTSDESFTNAKKEFDEKYQNVSILKQSLVTVDGKIISDIKIKNKNGDALEEYFKWQFIYAITKSGLFYKDHIGTEIWFPKGNKNSKPLKIDACIFDDENWLTHYLKWRKDLKDLTSLQFLRDHCIMTVEFKRGRDDLEQTFSTQLRPAMKESDSETNVGVIYDAGRLYLFEKRKNRVMRFDDLKNRNKNSSNVSELSLELPDSYSTIPSFGEVANSQGIVRSIDRSNRSLYDLDRITGRSSTQLKDALNRILKTLDTHSMSNQHGYEILIQTIAMKIFDEQRNKRDPDNALKFYVTTDELEFKTLQDKEMYNFIYRMTAIYDEAETHYISILHNKHIDWKTKKHVQIVQSIIECFQDYSFVESHRTDLYQLVFYNFAQPFQKENNAQFLTPLPLIEFLIKIINPRGDESVCDPCVGIADFLSLAYVHSKPKLNDANLWGVDIDDGMLSLAHLNMLLNGDGNAHLLHAKGDGSLNHKINKDGTLIPLVHDLHKCKEGENIADWDNWNDETKLIKFNVVLTNPPFGKGRTYDAKTQGQKNTLEMYETYWENNKPNSMDKGVLFLENAYHILADHGRMGIILSNSIASEDSNKKTIKWLLKKMRIVAIFDFPPDVFAETGVNTTVIVAYKIKPDELNELKSQKYTVFSRNISKIGYVKKTKQRNAVFENTYKISPVTYDILIDDKGCPILDEEFTTIETDFKEWARTQEKILQEKFLS